MITWKESRLQLRIGLLIVACVVAGCAGSKDSTPSSFDMSGYRQMMERQKGGQGSPEDPTPSAPEMTAEEHERAGDMDAQRRNFPLAGVHYSKALKADPSRNSVRLKLGQIFLQQGMLEPALTQFQDLRTREPNSAPAYQGIGHVYLLQGKLRDAEEALTKAVALDPSSWLSHNLLGLAYALSGDHDAAIQAYEQAVAAGSASPKLHNNLGVAYAHRQRYAAALESFKKATDEPRAYNNLGTALFSMGDPRQAAACFERAIELNPQFYEKAVENLRQARQALGNMANGTSASGSTDHVACP